MRNQELFNHMSREHGLTLLESEMTEIEIIVARMLATDRAHEAARQIVPEFAAPLGWAAVCDDNLPPLDEIVWLWDGQRIWIGGRDDDCDGWLWGNTYGTIWHNGAKWDGDLETDDDYKPTHWMRLPEPPNADFRDPAQ